MSKVIVGMSGGVDSATAAYLLKSQGHQVIGVFMRNWDSATNNDFLGNPNALASVCPEENDWQDAKATAKQLGIEIMRVDFVKEYWDQVFQDLIDKYKQGQTPNPDILCNKYIKFGVFYDWVFKNIQDVDYIATGHYAALEDEVLHKPKDKHKDQTYFLAQVNKKQFTKTLFPLANLTKAQVRKIAQENHLIVANKKDSTGICFIGERNFTEFLQNYIPAQPGLIKSIVTKEVLGKHVGVMYYTIGQRKGLNLGGLKEPHYVAAHDLTNKIIWVAPQSRPEFLMSKKAIIKNVNWFGQKQDNFDHLAVKFRYKSQSVKCTIKWLRTKQLAVTYPAGFAAVTPGQQAVFYDGNVCLGGGVIAQVFNDEKK